ncbi:MAG: glycosyltransferase family 4 protein [Anaerolineae bacterium]|nr:glycosyltransferase family 4 protein [Anaerolineae bacterium]
MVQIHQFSPTVSYGDASSNQTLSLQRMIRGLGYESEIFCDRMPLHFEGRARPFGQHARYSAPENVLLLHFSLSYSPRVMAWLKEVPDRKVLVYHNITPAAFFAGVNHNALRAAQTGRRQLGELRALAGVGWGDSAFNVQELTEKGWTRTGVLPIVFEPQRYQMQADRQVLKRWQGRPNVLFVGRISPSKRIDDLILAFYHLKRSVRHDARLLLVGSAGGMEPYAAYLRALVERLQVADVVFAGHVSHAELVAYYQCANVYLSMSEHEGFCVPLLESMHFGLPVVAFKSSAVPETLGGSGVLLREKDHASVAELIGLLMEDGDLRSRITARQRERLEDFVPDRVQIRLQQLLRELGV